MFLFVNACVRADSRTKRLADRFLAKKNGAFEEVRPAEIRFPVTDEAFLQERDRLLREGRLEDPLFDMARQFAAAEEILIAAPYWDLSFPAALKQYIEQINAVGITFRYTPEGIPRGLCRAKRLTFVTTAGGCEVPTDYGFGYIEALARGYWGIPEVRLIKAEGLDIDGADPDQILRTAAAEAAAPDRDAATIETRRLILRPFRESDYGDLYEFLAQLEDDEFEGYPGITFENGRRHLADRLGSDEYYALQLKETGKVIGNIFCGKKDPATRVMGYIVNENYRRQGYAYEALTAVMGELFRRGLHRAVARCDSRNLKSWRLMEKAGMRREAHFRQEICLCPDGRGTPVWRDSYVYALLAEEYFQKENAPGDR